MCGITGFYSFGNSVGRQDLHAVGQKMADTLTHRGPDSAGLWQDPHVPLLLGHRRLAIIDLTTEGRQPMESASGHYVVSYNGEIYNFLMLQASLEAAGVKFRGHSDTGVLLAAVEQWGLNQTLEKINGMFAFALWDRRTRTLHLVRDRLGKKPLYVGWSGKTLIFGSELKALRKHPEFTGVINRAAIALYMRYSYIPAPHCIYQNVWSLLPGHRLTLPIDSLEPGVNLATLAEPYWHPPHIVEEARDKAIQKSDFDTIEEFEALLTDCVQDRMVSDVPLGAFLSGGIDSSTIVALMQKVGGRPVKTYSIGFHEDGFDEAAFAKKIAAHLGTDHHELFLTSQDALGAIPQLPEIFDEPFADISAIPTYLVSRFARQDVTVALSGDGGDEMLGGYNRHIIAPRLWKQMTMLPPPFRRWLAARIKKRPAERWDKIFSLRPQFGTALYKTADILTLGGPEAIYCRLMSHWDAPQELVLNASEPSVPLTQAEWQPRHLSFGERMMYGDALSYLPNDILVKVDRATMAVSLEARAPLLDRRIFEYVWTLPEHMKVRDGKGKWLLRQVLHRHVPNDLFERPKQGFTMPIGQWLRGDLKDWAEDLLDEKRLRRDGYLDAGLVQQAWNDHRQGNGSHATKLWTVLMFQAWLASDR